VGERCPVTVCRVLATKELGLSFFKNFDFHEGGSRSLQFRIEFFNFFNTPHFNNPNSTIGAAGAGTITFRRLSFYFTAALERDSVCAEILLLAPVCIASRKLALRF